MTSLIIVTFEDVSSAAQAAKELKSMDHDKLIRLKDVVVVTKQADGKVKVDESGEFTATRGAVAGGTIGLIIGMMVGGPIGAAVLGGAAGALLGKKVDMGVSSDTIQAVIDKMHNASSAIFAEILSGDRELLGAAIRQLDGHLDELSVPDETMSEMEQTLGHITSDKISPGHF